MQYTDQKRIAVAVAGWGALGTLIIRAANFLDWMKRPESLSRVQDFLECRGARGALALGAYNEANPFGVSFGTDFSDAYVDCAERFMELWASEAHARIGGHGRVCMLVYESFAYCGYRERVYVLSIRRIAERIWWRGFSNV